MEERLTVQSRYETTGAEERRTGRATRVGAYNLASLLAPLGYTHRSCFIVSATNATENIKRPTVSERLFTARLDRRFSKRSPFGADPMVSFFSLAFAPDACSRTSWWTRSVKTRLGGIFEDARWKSRDWRG